jgi:hypothetical protein
MLQNFNFPFSRFLPFSNFLVLTFALTWYLYIFPSVVARQLKGFFYLAFELSGFSGWLALALPLALSRSPQY